MAQKINFYENLGEKLQSKQAKAFCETLSQITPKTVAAYKKLCDEKYANDDIFMGILSCRKRAVLPRTEVNREATMKLWPKLLKSCKQWVYIPEIFQAGRLNPDLSISMVETWNYWTYKYNYAASLLEWVHTLSAYGHAFIKEYEEKVRKCKSKDQLPKEVKANKWALNNWKPGQWDFPITELEHIIARGVQSWVGFVGEFNFCFQMFEQNPDVRIYKNFQKDRNNKQDYEAFLGKCKRVIGISTPTKYAIHSERKYDGNPDAPILLIREVSVDEFNPNAVNLVSNHEISKLLEEMKKYA